MKVIVTQATPWSIAFNAARWTMGLTKEIHNSNNDQFKTRLLMPQHSPIRMVEYDIRIEGIPYCNAVHFVRHHIGVEKFQCSLRDDRNVEIDDRKKLPHDYPVNLWISANADALIAISRRRLCNKASVETRAIWILVKKEIEKIDPTIARFMVRECLYRGFCPESPCCGYVQTTHFNSCLAQYREGFTQPI